jgi:ArsR family transcriptional regulator, arsenate/arsenite/antimonite-responsive transcriptional repressor
MTKSRGLQELQDFERVFKALAHESRRHILIVLNARGGSMTWPTTTRHLRVLENAGLVRVDKRGREWIYILESERIHKVVGGWLKWIKPPQERSHK